MGDLDLETARSIVSQRLRPLPTQTLPLLNAIGRASARDLRSDRGLPPFDRITMDGYALRAADSEGASLGQPVQLRVVGAAYPGRPSPRIGAGECVRAMTGAALPEGADAVIAVEKTAGYDDRIAQILSQVPPRANIAAAGEDLAQGGLLLSAGQRLRPAHVQALAACGHARLEVMRVPRAIVFSTGDELVDVAAQPGPLQIRESNAQTVRALLQAAGVDCAEGGIVPDSPSALRSALAPALDAHELVVVSGGVSRGERDHVKAVLTELGVELHFTQLKLRPGHPTSFGTRGEVAVFALPGNPVAVVAMLCAVFAPGLRRWRGERESPRRQWARLGFAHERRGDRLQLLPVSLQERAGELPQAHSTQHHGSGDFVSLAKADAFAVLGCERSAFAPGDIVEILPLEM